MECGPGGRLLISSTILTPFGAALGVAVPTGCPCAFLRTTTTGFPDCARLSWMMQTVLTNNKRAAEIQSFIFFLHVNRLILGLSLRGMTTSFTVTQKMSQRDLMSPKRQHHVSARIQVSRLCST